MSRISIWLSRFVAWIRRRLPAPASRAASGASSPPGFKTARRLFAHGLGLVFLAAFVSLLVQLRGLIGNHGISPAAELLPAAREQLGVAAYWDLPSIFWLNASNAALVAGCVAGVVFSLAMAMGVAPGLCAMVLWALYLSFCSISSPFLDFQWDSLLLETALPAALFLPWRLRPQWQRVPPAANLGRWLIWWLIFRLMLESGLVKIASGDPTWRNLTAMAWHYETQPLPLWTAWYAHHLPLWLHRLEALLTFLVELAAPFAILLPRPFRHAAACAIILLQAGILATGNFAFFNWLTILLCIPLLDDGFWSRWLRLPSPSTPPVTVASTRWIWPAGIAAAAAFLVTAAPLAEMVRQCVRQLRPAESPDLLDAPSDRASAEFSPLARVRETLAPLRSFNSYGLFAVMTTERPEIIVEGSNDGQIWKAYEFRWKPGDIRERPRLVEPHQPRLDWQMWFAALGSPRQNLWFLRFLQRLHEGAPDVVGLLRTNPFPDAPPRYLRALLYDYRFTTSADSSAWWRRELRGLYWPPQAASGQAGE